MKMVKSLFKDKDVKEYIPNLDMDPKTPHLEFFTDPGDFANGKVSINPPSILNSQWWFIINYKVILKEIYEWGNLIDFACNPADDGFW